LATALSLKLPYSAHCCNELPNYTGPHYLLDTTLEQYASTVVWTINPQLSWS
jgi:hypothetical protein